MGTLLCLICIAVANLVVLGQPSAAQRANTTLLLTYPGQILQADGSQTCHSEGQRKRVRNEVDSAMLSLLRESAVPLLQNFSCGGSFGWRRAAYLDMSDPSQPCPYVWRRSISSSGSCEGLIYSTGSAQYNQVCGRIIGYQLGNTDGFLGSRLSIDTNYVDGVSVTHGTPANTSGHSLMVLMNFPQVTPMQHAPVSLGALMDPVFPHLWGRIVSVRQA